MSPVDILSSLFLLLLTLPVTASVVRAVRLRRGENRRRMFAASYRTICDGVEHAGISVLSVGATDPATVSRLLDSEYERCEVIVVTDSSRNPEFIEALTQMFALVGVDCRMAEVLPAQSAVRRLFRSRRRRFRRLTVVDTFSDGAANDADTALGLSVYDYAALLDGDTVLLPGAVERVVAEISSSVVPPREIATTAGACFRLCMRDDAVARGGFSSGAKHFCRRSERVSLDEPLAVGCGCGTRGRAVLAVSMAATASAAVLLAVVSGSALPVAALAAAWLAVSAAVFFSASFSAPHLSGFKAFAYSMRNFCENLL